ncbi:hypothetical protein GCM10027610_129450 [Dactylosporangium cerinum]
MRGEGVGVAALPFGRGVDVRAVPDERDPAVAVPEQVRGAGVGAAVVVEQDRVDVDVAGRAVGEDRVHPHLQLGQQVAVVVTGRHHDEPVDAPLHQ